MKLFVGLGNPGDKYAKNRHNIGWMAVERIAEENGFGPWRSKFQGQVSEGRLGADKVMLLKPETFMNLSGQSVGEAMRFYKLEPADVWVFHDELDLAPSRMKCKVGGGHAGHNGLRSIHQHIGEAYGRVRLGIGHPGHKDRVSGYVLGDFAKADQNWLDDMMRGIGKGAAFLAEGDTGRFSTEVARYLPKVEKPKPAKKAEPSAIAKAKAAPAKAPDQADPAASPLQRLLDKFR